MYFSLIEVKQLFILHIVLLWRKQQLQYGYHVTDHGYFTIMYFQSKGHNKIILRVDGMTQVANPCK